MARIVDLGGTLNEYNTSLSNAQADRLAFRADIAALRGDLAVVLERLNGENEQASQDTALLRSYQSSGS